MLLPAPTEFHPSTAGVLFDAAHPALVSVAPPGVGMTTAEEARILGVRRCELGEGNSAAPPFVVLVSDANIPISRPTSSGEARMGTRVQELGESTPAIPPNAVLVSDASSPGSTSPADVVGMTAAGDASMCEDGDMATNLPVCDSLGESKPNSPPFVVRVPV